MSHASWFVVMATVPIEYRYEHLDNERSILAHLGGYIGPDARIKDEFITAGLLYLDSFPAIAQAYLRTLTWNPNSFNRRQTVLGMIKRSSGVDRAEYQRLLSARWDRDYA